MLILLANMCRISDVAQLDLAQMTRGDGHLSFRLETPTKNFTEANMNFGGTALQTLVIEEFEDEKLCPVRAIECYIERSKGLRGSVTKLFIITGFNPNAASIQSISRLAKRILKDAGFGEFTVHSGRSASASNALLLGLSISSILRKAGWRSESTFIKKYMKNPQCILHDVHGFSKMWSSERGQHLKNYAKNKKNRFIDEFRAHRASPGVNSGKADPDCMAITAQEQLKLTSHSDSIQSEQNYNASLPFRTPHKSIGFKSTYPGERDRSPFTSPPANVRSLKTKGLGPMKTSQRNSPKQTTSRQCPVPVMTMEHPMPHRHPDTAPWMTVQREGSQISADCRRSQVQAWDKVRQGIGTPTPAHHAILQLPNNIREGPIHVPMSPHLKAQVPVPTLRTNVELLRSLPLGPKDLTGSTRQGVDLAVSGGRVSVVRVGRPVNTSEHSGWNSVMPVTQSTSSPRPQMFAKHTSPQSSRRLPQTSENFANGELIREQDDSVGKGNTSADMLEGMTTGLPDLDVSMVTSELSKIEHPDFLISLLQNCKTFKQHNWTFIHYSGGEIATWGEKCVRNNLERDIKRLYLDAGSKVPSQKTLRNRATLDRLLVPEGGGLLRLEYRRTSRINGKPKVA